MRNNAFHGAGQGRASNLGDVTAIALHTDRLEMAGGPNERVTFRVSQNTLNVMLLPNKAPDYATRRLWASQAPRVVMIMDDSPELGGARGPGGFDATTLQWALREHSLIIHWECGMAPHITKHVQGLVDRFARVLIVLSRLEHRDEWVPFIGRWAKPNATLQFLHDDARALDLTGIR